MRVGLFFSLLCVLGVSSLSAQAYRLQFKDAEGAKRVYATHVDLTGNVTMGSVSSPINSTMTMTAFEQINTVKNGASSVLYEVKDGKVSVKVPNLAGDESTGAPLSIDQQVPDFSMAFNRTPLGKISNLHVNGGSGDLIGAPPNEVNDQLLNP